MGVVLTALALYALNVEPGWVDVTTHTVGAGQSDRPLGPIRIVQISDLHLRRFGDREVRLTQTIRDLKPNAIVFTGDIIDRAENLALLESFLAALGPTPSQGRGTGELGVLGHGRFAVVAKDLRGDA